MNTLTSMLDRMEAAGLVRRDRGDHDRRKILIYLTAEAKALEQDYNAVTAEIESIYYKDFSSEEIDALEGYLRRVLTNVEEAL
jgi:DNA-binding MarR family transcriptional regulator